MTTSPPLLTEEAAARVGAVVLLGSEMILLLLTGYVLFELGAALLRRVQVGRCPPERAKILFGVGSLVFALLPGVLAGYAVRTKLAGLNLEMFAGVGIVLASMTIGFLGQLGALLFFFRQAVRLAPKETAAPAPRVPPSAPHVESDQADTAP